MEDVREAFLLYHMNIIPMAITHMPTDTNKGKMSVQDNENGYSSSIFSRMLSNISIDMVGNSSTLAFSVLISSLVSLAKSDLYHTKKNTHISIVKIIFEKEL